MPVIRTFVSHHGGDYEKRVAPILRRAAPLGVRPWLDKRDLLDKVGLPLDQLLQDAIFKGSCSSLTLFLTKSAATRQWIEQEVQWALERVSEGFRILPILLDPREEIDLPESFVSFMDRRKVVWLEPDKNPRFLQSYAASVHAAGGVDKNTAEVTLYLGHRSEHWDAVLPAELATSPALHIRLDLDGDRNFSPTELEWQEIESGLTTLRKNLERIERINVCGQAPLGVAGLIGKVWDRSTGLAGPIQLRCFNMESQKVWTTDSTDYELASTWTPERSQHVKMERPAALRHKTLLLALLPEGRTEEYLRNIQRWNDRRETPALVHVAQLPRALGDPELAREVLRECVGVVRYLYRNCRGVDAIEVVPGYALAMAPLFLHHLRNVGPVHLYDQVKGTGEYRRVTSLE